MVDCLNSQKTYKKKQSLKGTALVPRTGIEPARLAAHAPETCASTYSATWAAAPTFRSYERAKIHIKLRIEN